MTPPRLVEHFFRHEYGRLVARLSRRLGVSHVELIEDAVQSALMSALERWARDDVPDNPAGWLYRVAYNNAVGNLRRRGERLQLLARHADALAAPGEAPADPPLASEVQDDQLRMIFICCDDGIPPDSQLVLALKTLCGFDVGEIALRLFTSEANVYKRLTRARERLRGLSLEVAFDRHAERLSSVQRVLYLLFTEGHLSARAELPVRQELCREAIRLANVLVEHAAGGTPETFALLALMHLHAARMTTRVDASGGLLLLSEQDRGRWDREEIALGLGCLSRSAEGETFSRYHAEAGIAAEHCLADSFEATRWDRVAACYALLERSAPSPLHRLNRAVAVAEWRGPAAGLELLEGTLPPTWLSGSYLWAAVLADLHRRCGHAELADRHRAVALATAPSPAVVALLERRLG